MSRKLDRIFNTKRRRKSDIKMLLNLDAKTFDKLDADKMRKIVNILAKEANKRISEFKKVGEESPATRSVEKSGGRFSSANKNLNALRSEYIREKNYFESKTGEIHQYHKFQDTVIDTLEADHNIYLTRDNWGELWRTYDKVKELNPKAAHLEIKYKVINVINEMIIEGKKSGDEIVLEVKNKAKDIYEDYMKEESKKPSVSKFFDIT